VTTPKVFRADAASKIATLCFGLQTKERNLCPLLKKKLLGPPKHSTVIALNLLNSTIRSGRKVTGGNVAFYTIKMLRSGRRSTGERRNDPMHPKAQLNGTCSRTKGVHSIAG